MQFIPETRKRERRMDWTGFGLMALGIATLQYLLDRGNQRDWFESIDIVTSAVLSIVCLSLFVVYSLKRGDQAIFNVRMFQDRNFGLACLIMSAMGLGMFGGLVLQPILLEGLLGYPIVTTGLVMAPRGIATAIAMIVVGRLVSIVDARILVTIGIICSAIGAYAMTFYSLETTTINIIWPAFLQGIGLGLIFVPLSTIAYATLDRSRMAEAAGMYSLVRTIGASIGISIVTTVMTHQAQIIWNELGAHITVYQGAVTEYLARLGLQATDPRGLAIIAREVGMQSQMGALLDAFKLITWSYAFMMPLIFLLRRSTTRTGAPAAAMD
jgi:DHA2 family multidrug resistance protein